MSGRVESEKEERYELENLIQPQSKIPYAFRMPKDKVTFVEKNFPGDYDELLEKYPVGAVVSELDSYKKKLVYVLKGINNNDTCYLIPVDQANSEHQDIVRVLLCSHLHRRA